jgi:hydrogenase nickel incorporation protein HypA/HybF
MHEMVLAEGILGVVLDVAEGREVQRVQLRVGALQHVTPDSLQFCFQLVAEDTSAANAIIEFETVPAWLRCRKCHRNGEAASPPFLCRHCGASEVDLISGDELLVEAIELDTGWHRRPQPEEPSQNPGIPEPGGSTSPTLSSPPEADSTSGRSSSRTEAS